MYNSTWWGCWAAHRLTPPLPPSLPPPPSPPEGATVCPFGPFWADFKSKLLTFEFFYVKCTVFCTLGPFWADFKSKLLTFEIINVNCSFLGASGVVSAISEVITYFRLVQPLFYMVSFRKPLLVRKSRQRFKKKKKLKRKNFWTIFFLVFYFLF